MEIQKIKKDANFKLLKKQNVVGTGIGTKITNGIDTEQQAIIVFVEKKSTKDSISKMSSKDAIPTEINGVPTDVIEVGRITKQGFRHRSRPIKPGFSCGHGSITCGTIGGFFKDKDGDIVCLSNNHVLANENKCKKGDLIYQPGPSDNRSKLKFRGWDAKNVPYFGVLKDFVSLNGRSNKQDSAIAKVHESYINGDLIDYIYPTINKKIIGFAKASSNMMVQKCGRTTGYTTGRVIATDATFTVDYDFGPARFNNCIVCTNMSQGGDSGSLILDMHMNAVGLLFAGSDKVTIANPIDLVKQRYGLHIPESNIDLGDLTKWRRYTTDGQLTVTKNLLSITDNANHHCFLEASLDSKFKSFACSINTGTDKGTIWGPGIVIQFPNGMIKMNAKYQSSFGGYFNSKNITNVGQVKNNHEYRFRITRDNEAWKCEVKDSNKWMTVMAVAKSALPHDPTSIRIGKTGDAGSTTDLSPPRTKDAGHLGSCNIYDVTIN